VLVLWAGACGNDTVAPTTRAEPPELPTRPRAVAALIPAVTVRAGEALTVEAAPYFGDPDRDPLRCSATAADTSVVSTSVAGIAVTIAGDLQPRHFGRRGVAAVGSGSVLTA